MSAVLPRARSTRFLATTIAATLGGAVLLAGCGGGDDDETAKAGAQTSPQTSAEEQAATPAPSAAKPYDGQKPAEIYDAMVAKVKKAKTVHLKANIKDSGGRITMDVQLSRGGKAAGALSLPADGSMKIILNGDKGWFKGGQDMYAKIAGGNDSVNKKLSGQWVAFRKGEGMDDVWALADMKTFTDESLTPTGPESDIVRVKGRKTAGRQTIGLKEKSSPGVIYVAADGSAELVGISDKDGKLTYTDWDQPVKAKAPAKSLNLKDFQ
jgi:hypothetical protein